MSSSGERKRPMTASSVYPLRVVALAQTAAQLVGVEVAQHFHREAFVE
jgi:hypothetical protein